MRYILILLALIQFACVSSAKQQDPEIAQIQSQTQSKPERKAFKKSPAEIKSPVDYSWREAKNGRKYDPKPRVVPIDERSGRYELRWIGYDGKEKVIKYQRNDALDAVLEAKVEKQADGKFLYRYLIKNLPGSPTYLSSFTVQTFAKDVQTTRMEDVYIAAMAAYINDFREGTWWNYGILGETLKISPGRQIEFSLASAAAPGIVSCHATAGELDIKGVGEHMPAELEKAMPGFEEDAKGYTVAPVERLAALSKAEKAKYVLDSLPMFQEAGWMAEDTAKIYTSLLKKDDLGGALKQAKSDLGNGFVTNEVVFIIENLN